MKIEVPAHIDISALSSFIALSQVSRVPLMIWGHPGIGKTSIVRQYAEQTSQHCEVIIGSTYEPPDIVGNVYLTNHEKWGRIQTHSVPEWVVRVMENYERGISSVVFFDEITTCMAEVQAAMLRIINERVVAGIELPQDTLIVAASNFPGSSSGFYFSPALGNRFMHVSVTSCHDVDDILLNPITKSLWDLYVSGWKPSARIFNAPVSSIEPSVVFRTPRTEEFYSRVRAASKAADINGTWWYSTIRQATIGNVLLGDEDTFELLVSLIRSSSSNANRKQLDLINRKVADMVNSDHVDVYVPLDYLKSSDTAVIVATLLCTKPEQVVRVPLALSLALENIDLLMSVGSAWVEDFTEKTWNYFRAGVNVLAEKLLQGNTDDHD
ncbi:MAG: MoxR family ATPase [Nitrososphaerota archaeon]